jgi:hypothetical protein
MSSFDPLLWRKPPMRWSIGIVVVSVAATLLISRRPSFHLQSAPLSLFLCAVMIIAWFAGNDMGLWISRSIINWDDGRLRTAGQSPCGEGSYLTLPVIIEVGGR